MANYVIFSIDNVHDLRTLSKFTGYLDTLKAMQKLKGSVVLCVGSYKGVMEQSFIMLKDDFEDHVRFSDYLNGQESILHVEDGHYGIVYGSLEFLDTGAVETIGTMREVSQSEAMEHDGWTYRPDVSKYWVFE